MANNTAPVVSASIAPGSYYMTVFALTPKETTASQEESPLPQEVPVYSAFSPYVIFAPFLLFFAIFISAFGMQVLRKSWNIKRIIIAVVIALFAASTPFALTFIEEGTQNQTKAGPEETPKQVNIIHMSPASVLVTWETDAPEIGAIRYSYAPLTPSKSTVLIADSGNAVKRHSLTIEKLQNKLMYEVEIFSGSRWYANQGQPLQFVLGKR